MSSYTNKTTITSKFYIFLSIIIAIAIFDTYVLAEKFQSGSPYKNLSNHISLIETEVLKLESYIDIYLAAMNVEGYMEEDAIVDIKEQSYVLSKKLAGIYEPKYYDVLDKNKSIAMSVNEIDGSWHKVEENMMLFYGAFSDDDIYMIHNNIDVHSSLLIDGLRLLVISLDDLDLKNEKNAMRWIVFVLFLSFGFIAVLSYLFINITLKPLGALVDKSSLVLAGDRSVRFDSAETTEIALISNVMNSLLDNIDSPEPLSKTSVPDKDYVVSHMTSLNKVIKFAGKSVSSEEFYNKLVDEALDVTGAMAVMVYTVNFEKLELKVCKGFDDRFSNGGEELPADGRHEGNGLRRVTKTYSDLDAVAETKYKELLKEQGVRTLVSAPVLRGDAVIGYLDVAFNKTFAVDHNVAFLNSVALTMGVVVGYTELFFEAHGVRRFLERIFDQIPVGMAILEKDGSCSYANASLKSIFGCGLGYEIVGRYLYADDVNFTTNGFSDSIKKSFVGFVDDVDMDFNPQLARGFGFTGLTRRFKIKTTPIYDSSGSISNAMLTFILHDSNGSN